MMRQGLGLFSLFVLVMALLVSPASAETVGPAEALERLFLSDEIDTDWFSPEFLSYVPIEQVRLVIGQLLESLGRFVGLEGSGAEYAVLFEEGSVPAQIALDEGGRITGIFLGPPELRVAGVEDVLRRFDDLPGKVAFVVMKDGAVVGARRADEALAVGSAFKLAVLGALKAEVDAGLRSWEDVVHLEPGWISLPTGVLQEWPVGTALTLETLASMMISISDNTATDALIDVVGREAVERAFAVRNVPLLTTRESFILKDPANSELLSRYRAADAEERRALLEEASRLPLPGADIYADGPLALDVEWFYTPVELCSLMAYVQDLPLMQINPGVADPAEWERVAFKGGSEPGVFSLTTWLVDASGSEVCVSATWNDTKPLDELRFVTYYDAILDALKE